MATVLLVDADLETVRLLSDIVMEIGHTPLFATSAHDALILARTLHPGMIITTIDLPPMDRFISASSFQTGPTKRDILIALHTKISTYLQELSSDYCLLYEEWKKAADDDHRGRLMSCATLRLKQFTNLTHYRFHYVWLLWQPL